MDLDSFAQHARAKIEAGQMVNLVRDALKEVKLEKQDAYERQRESMEPVIEQLEELKEEVATAAPAPAPLEVEGAIAPLAVEGAPAQPRLVVDPNHGFTAEELETLTQLELPTPLEAFAQGEEVASAKIAAGRNKRLGARLRHASPDRRRVLGAHIALNRKYMERMKAIEKGRATLVRGKGMMFYNSPDDLWDRLNLLGGSMRAGNNSRPLKRQFSAAAHKLRDIKAITNQQLTDILREYAI